MRPWRSVAGLSPVLGFHTAAAAFMIAFASTYIALQISHRRTNHEINENGEVGSVNREGRLSTLVVALLQTLAVITSSVGAAAVLG